MEYAPYRFASLETYSHDEVTHVNRACQFVADPVKTVKMLQALGQMFLSYDICNFDDAEIYLLVRTLGDIRKTEPHHFQKTSITIGRSDENDLPLKSPLVSKNHVEISRRGTEYYIKDLNSSNGTHLNDVKLVPGTPVLLKNDDVVKIEPFEISLGLSTESAKRPIEIRMHSVRARRQVNSTGQISIFFLIQPSQTTGVLLLEERAARWMVQKMIAAQKDSAISPWSEIEAAILEYLTCKVLATLNPFLKGSRLMLASIEKEEVRVQNWFSSQPSVVELAFAAEAEIGVIYGSLYLPLALLEEVRSQVDIADFLSRMEWIRSYPYVLSIQLGVSLLTPDQISMLEDGDIILLDRAEIVLAEDLPRGKVALRSDRLQRGVIRVSLECEKSGKSSITVESLYKEGLEHMTDASKRSLDAQSGPNEGVLSNLELPVVVEFARLNFTLEEIASMKEGQVIEMEKAQPELVDLTVEGKVIANGKLVDVEGKLGVRILKISKGK